MKITKKILIFTLLFTIANVYSRTVQVIDDNNQLPNLGFSQSDWKECLTHGVLKQTILITEQCAENINTAPSMDNHTSKWEIDMNPLIKDLVPHDPSCFSERTLSPVSNPGL